MQRPLPAAVHHLARWSRSDRHGWSHAPCMCRDTLHTLHDGVAFQLPQLLMLDLRRA